MQRESAEWFKAAFDAVEDLVLIKGPRSELLWANRAFRAYYGMTEAELRDIVDAEHSDPDDTLQYVIDDRTVLETRSSLNIPQESVTDAQGNARLFHTIKSPILEGDEVVCTIGISRLCDDQLIARREVDHHDAKAFVAPLRSLSRCFPNPMLMVDVKSRVLQSSPLWDRSFGTTGRSPNSFFEDVYPEMPDLGDAIAASVRDQEHKEMVLHITGEDATFSVQINPWFFADDTIGGAIVIATDNSEIHRKSLALQTANEELTQYAYRASHDLKGPISTAKGLATFIAEDIQNGDLAEALANTREIEALLSRLERNVGAILSLAQADLKVEAQSVIDVEETLSEIADDLAMHSAQAGVEVKHALQVATIVSQPTRFQQICANLIANAIKYHSPNRNPRFVKIATTAVADGVELTVSDNGIGIPEAGREKIFERFTRYHSDSDGSGLGLAIVRKNVDVLGGRVTFDSSDAGTVFRVFLPQEIEVEVAC